MEYRELGRTGIRVSSVALGCWGFAGGSMWGDQDEGVSVRAVRSALDSGMNFLDTAEAYGDGYSEEIVGKAVAGRRADAVIATKASTGNCTPAGVAGACEKSLRRLGTDYIDLYQLHWPSAPDVDVEETEGALERLVSGGKIRSYGVCNYGTRDMSRLKPESGIVSNQVAYSILFRAVEHEIAPYCGQRDVSILTYSSLMHGLLTGKYRTADEFPAGRGRTRHFSSGRGGSHGGEGFEDLTFETIRKVASICDQAGLPLVTAAVLWVLKNPAVTSVLAGARDTEQVGVNARITDSMMTDDVYDAICGASEGLKEAMGPCADMWKSAEESRIR